jgi:hypothetical protein
VARDYDRVLAQSWTPVEFVAEWSPPERRMSLAEILAGTFATERTPKRTEQCIWLEG